jgi:hypothetical protein
MCGAPSTSREHAPPDSFFPKGAKEGLVTVPSCDEHNLKNSLDVEYVRNAIVTHIATNDAARNHFQGKVLRSLQRSPKLRSKLFGNVLPVQLGSTKTGIFSIDINRFKSVMACIAGAMYYKDYGRCYPGQWKIISTSLASERKFLFGVPDGWEEIRRRAGQLGMSQRPTSQPDIFQYHEYHKSDLSVIYRLTFYGGFEVYAIGYPPWTT